MKADKRGKLSPEARASQAAAASLYMEQQMEMERARRRAMSAGISKIIGRPFEEDIDGEYGGPIYNPRADITSKWFVAMRKVGT